MLKSCRNYCNMLFLFTNPANSWNQDTINNLVKRDGIKAQEPKLCQWFSTRSGNPSFQRLLENIGDFFGCQSYLGGFCWHLGAKEPPPPHPPPQCVGQPGTKENYPFQSASRSPIVDYFILREKANYW